MKKNYKSWDTQYIWIEKWYNQDCFIFHHNKKDIKKFQSLACFTTWHLFKGSENISVVLVIISCFTFGSYFSMADELCTICLFLISNIKPNNEINGEYKTEEKISRVLQVMDINKNAEKLTSIAFQKRSKREANMNCREHTPNNKCSSEFHICSMG